jgi:NADH-quinone oxidoreductase subunit E
MAAVEMAIPDERTFHERIETILGRYNYEKRWLISILFDIQREYNYLPKEALVDVARKLDVSLTKVYSIATFFKAFTLKPRGRTHVTACLGTACHVRGAVRVLEEIERRLCLKPGETSSDGDFSLETVNCLGSCALGPIVVVNEKYHGRMTTSQIRNLLKKRA